MATTDQKLTVLYVDAAPWFGGAQRSLETLITGMLEDGRITPVLLAADRSPSGLVERARTRRILTRSLSLHHWSLTASGLARFLLDMQASRRRIRSLMRTVKPDLLHANSLRSALAVALCGIRNIPLLLHSRDVREPRVVRRWIARRLQGLLAVSNTVLETWDGIVPPDLPAVAIPNGFDLRRFENVVPAPSLFPQDPPLVLLVADLVQWKRHDLFVRAFGLVHAQRPEVRGVVIGRPVAADSRRLLAELKRLSRAVGTDQDLVFRTSEHDALGWIAAGSVVVSCSEREPFGRTVVEALALGKPVAATRGGGPEVILADCPVGFITGARPGELARGILDALDASQQPVTAETARRFAQRFDIRRVLPLVVQFYERILDRGKERSRPGAIPK